MTTKDKIRQKYSDKMYSILFICHIITQFYSPGRARALKRRTYLKF